MCVDIGQGWVVLVKFRACAQSGWRLEGRSGEFDTARMVASGGDDDEAKNRERERERAPRDGY